LDEKIALIAKRRINPRFSTRKTGDFAADGCAGNGKSVKLVILLIFDMENCVNSYLELGEMKCYSIK
jgi:hypothetical protein